MSMALPKVICRSAACISPLPPKRPRLKNQDPTATNMSYQSVPTTAYPALVPAVSMDREEHAFEIQFDREAGYNYLCTVPSILIPCLFPLFALVARKNIDAQKCTVTDRRVIFESGWLDHSNKNIPLDRIQDVNVRQDCIQKCFGVKTIEIQTAGMGGGLEPEAKLIAPVDAMIVRDIIMDRRDALVLGHPGVLESGGRADDHRAKGNEKSEEFHRKQTEQSNAVVVEELRSIKDTLGRLEAQVKAGVDHLVAK